MERAESELKDGTNSGYRSRFGGLWTDRGDALERLAELESRGAVDGALAQQLRDWIARGLVVLEGAVATDLVDRIREDLERIWAGEVRGVFVEEWTEGVRRISEITKGLATQRTKLLDLYAYSEAARQANFSPALVGFLRALFERPPMAFQSLMFMRGTGQPMHQDSAFVGVRSPLEFVGSWLALEDIRPGSGELEYYVGSHAMEEYLFPGEKKRMPPRFKDEEAYLASVHERALHADLERSSLLPRKGDVILWHADLAHGGSPIQDPELTRRSLVTHYCPADVAPDYFRKVPHSGRVAWGSGAFYCHPRRWAPSPLARGALRLTRTLKTAGNALLRGLR